MIKTTRDYLDLIKGLEDYAKTHPKLYKLKVNLLCHLSSAVIILTLLLSILMIVSIISILVYTHGKGLVFVIKFLLFPIVILFFLLKSLFIKFTEPYGIKITKKDCPELFKVIDSLRKDLKAPPIDKVMIDYIFNAYISQYPRFGFLGFPKNYLVIGLPVLEFLNHNEFKAIIAHEIGHISKKHGSTGSRVYMVESVWSKFLKELEQDGNITQFLFKKFAEWYLPYLRAYSFIISRNHEYEADKLASEAAGVDAATQGLIKIHVIGSYVDTIYWNNFLKKAIKSPDCPKDAMNQLISDVVGELKPNIVKKEYQKQLASKSETYLSTHPSLSDRIKAIEGQTSLPEIVKFDDAKKILEPSYEKIIEKLNNLWFKDNEIGWQKNYLYFNEVKDSMAKLEQKALEEKINITEAWEFAASKHIIDGKNCALPLYKVVLEFDPEHIEANYRAGKILLENLDESGLGYVYFATDKDERYKLPVFWDLYNYYNELDDRENADKYFQKYLDAVVEDDLANNERRMPIDTINLKEIKVDSDYILRVKLLLQEYKEVKKAYIVQKDFKYFAEYGEIIFALEIDYGFWGEFKPLESKASVSNNIINTFASQFPYPKDYKGSGFVCSMNFNETIKKKILKIPESLIYERKKSK